MNTSFFPNKSPSEYSYERLHKFWTLSNRTCDPVIELIFLRTALFYIPGGGSMNNKETLILVHQSCSKDRQ